MADSFGQADIRGLDIDRVVKGFADEASIMKQFCTVTPTSSRQIRWWQKTSGFLDSTDTTDMTTSRIADVAFGALPEVVEPSVTRQTSYVKKYAVESPWISIEDIADTDPDIMTGLIRDLMRAVGNQVDIAIFTVMHDTYGTGGNVNTAAAVADGWDDDETGDPITDILVGKQKIRSNGYDPDGCILLINSIEEKNLIRWLINVKGSSIPGLSSDLAKGGKVTGLLNCRIVVSENATTDYAFMFLPGRALTFKSFKPMTSYTLDNPGIGKKYRIVEEGVALLTDPKAVHVITDTVV